ncbi:MAG: AAA family ATPase [Gammaproteobacteria bacterium]|nr:AAA family ATPase [Gammaproteobacteria bacterium]
MAQAKESPKSFSEHYDAESRANVMKIWSWFDLPETRAQRWTMSALARTSKVPVSTLHHVLHGTAEYNPKPKLEAVLAVVNGSVQPKTPEKTVRELPFVETSIYKMVLAAAKRAQRYKNFSVVSAFVGTGKTTAVQRYCEEHPKTILIHATPDMNAAVLLDRLVVITSAHVKVSRFYTRGTRAARMEGVLESLRARNRLLILDEAETVSPSTLEYLRRVRDLADCGVVLAGTERLEGMLRDPRGRFGQISSRVGYWVSAQAIKPEDAHALAAAAFETDGIDLNEELLDAFWQACDGSARVLCEGIIPGVRDYGLSDGRELTPALIFQVTQKVLGFRARRK